MHGPASSASLREFRSRHEIHPMTQPFIEAITLDEAAVRCRITRETFTKHYDGPVTQIGRERRVHVEDLNDWLRRCAGVVLRSDTEESWGAFE